MKSGVQAALVASFTSLTTLALRSSLFAEPIENALILSASRPPASQSSLSWPRYGSFWLTGEALAEESLERFALLLPIPFRCDGAELGLADVAHTMRPHYDSCLNLRRGLNQVYHLGDPGSAHAELTGDVRVVLGPAFANGLLDLLGQDQQLRNLRESVSGTPHHGRLLGPSLN